MEVVLEDVGLAQYVEQPNEVFRIYFLTDFVFCCYWSTDCISVCGMKYFVVPTFVNNTLLVLVWSGCLCML
jgi:hypothetical protein